MARGQHLPRDDTLVVVGREQYELGILVGHRLGQHLREAREIEGDAIWATSEIRSEGDRTSGEM